MFRGGGTPVFRGAGDCGAVGWTVESGMASIALFLTHRAHPGRRDDVRAAWERHMPAAVGANPGHLAYAWCLDEADPDVIRVFQRYADDEDAAAFVRSPEYAAYLADVEPLLAGPPELHRARPVWSKP